MSLVWGLATGSPGWAEACCCSGRRGACSGSAAAVEAWVCCIEGRQEARWGGGLDS
jgi:hypothetical protein